jgi:hypothetical protein
MTEDILVVAVLKIFKPYIYTVVPSMELLRKLNPDN